MSNELHTHVAFADESNWNSGDFRSISLISAEAQDARLVHRELFEIRNRHGGGEFKWARPNRSRSIELADVFFLHHERMRVDVLLWDMRDSRHRGVQNRDDHADFARMYYHLLHNVLGRRWPDGARWLICPDKQGAVNWSTLEECLGWKSWAVEEHLFTSGGGMPGMREFYNITEIREVCSKEYLLVQMADLFAGLAAFSHASFEKYIHWKSEQDTTPSLFNPSDVEGPILSLTRSEKARFPLLDHVRAEAGRRKLQVSLESSKGLSTKNPRNPLNFWLYQPQRPGDKAPVNANAGEGGLGSK